MWRTIKTAVFMLFLASFAHADIGLMLGESTGAGMSRWTSAGHSAVYLSRVCPDTPVHLRLCAPGEQGSVISNYISFNEDKPYEWNIVPLSVFLYGVDEPENRPLYASPALRSVLQEHFREKHLVEICPQGPCTDPKAHWRDVIAANFVRDIYMFEVSTSLEQDITFINKFNALPNIDHYNGFTRNCADFARLVVNSYFPGAARADHMNDFWMTSPKAISKSFTHYAVKHPELQFRVVRFTQIPGSYRRSSDARKGTEVAFTSKKWFFPMLLRSNELIMFTASYMLTGRFNPERELQRRPSDAVTALLLESKDARREGDPELAKFLQTIADREREGIFGNKEDWDRYADALNEYRDEADIRALLSERPKLKDLASALDEHGHITFDAHGALWLDYESGDESRHIGISASNVNAGDSDGEFAYALMLVRSDAVLANAPKNREMLPEFRADWHLLENARQNLAWKVLARRSHLSNSASMEPDQRPAESSTSFGTPLLP